VLRCPWCNCPRGGQERLCLGCSRPLPLQVFDSPLTELAFADEASETVAHGMHNMSVELALTRLGQAFLEGQLEGEAYLAKLDWLEAKLLAIDEEMTAGIGKGRASVRTASVEQKEHFEAFEEQAQEVLQAISGAFQDTISAMADLEQSPDLALVEEARGYAAQAMAAIEHFDLLCDQIKRQLR